MRLFIGTSGYSYQHWAGRVFYPEGLASSQWLEFYCQQFNSVELNVTFYRLPKKAAFVGWNNRTPEDFRFALKGSRYITHIKRLKDVADSLKYFEENIQPLLPKIECVLWQFPPKFKKDAGRLADFCRQLAGRKLLSRTHHSFEFRENSWFCQDIYAILKNYKHVICFADALQKTGEEVVLGDFVYVRFHGGKTQYASHYTDDELQAWARKIRGFGNKVQSLYAFFNNDACGYAPVNAGRLRQLLDNSQIENCYSQ